MQCTVCSVRYVVAKERHRTASMCPWHLSGFLRFKSSLLHPIPANHSICIYTYIRSVSYFSSHLSCAQEVVISLILTERVGGSERETCGVRSRLNCAKFHQVPIASGWTEAMWGEKLPHRDAPHTNVSLRFVYNFHTKCRSPAHDP